MFKKLIESWKQKNKQVKADQNPKPKCSHPQGHFREQCIEEPEWGEGNSLRFRIVKKKYWYCPECIKSNGRT